MATRRKGALAMDRSVELSQKLPLDARAMVRTKEELLDAGSFADNGYNGMVVACREEQKLYMLIDQNNPTLEASWKDMSASSGTGGGEDITALTDEEIAALLPA